MIKKIFLILLIILFFSLTITGCCSKASKELEELRKIRKEVSDLLKIKKKEGFNINEARELVFYAIQTTIIEKDFKKGIKYFKEALKILNKLSPQTPKEYLVFFQKRHFGGKGDIHDVKSAGLKWVITYPGPVIWGNIERKRSSYNWQEVDHYVIECQNSNLYPIIIIWPYAKWDQAEKSTYKVFSSYEELGNYRTKPRDITSYQIFIRKLVDRYNGDGIEDMPNLKYPIKYWQILSYPSSSGQPYSSFEGTVADYIELLKITYPAIKSADPSSRVILGDSPSSFQYWSDFFKKDPKKYFDAANINIQNYNEFKTYLKIFKKHKIKSFIISDIQNQSKLRDRAKTIELFKVIIEALSQGAGKIFLSLENPIIINTDINKSYFYNALGLLLHKIDEFNTIKKIDEGQYKLTNKSNNKITYVLWGWKKIPKEIKSLGNVNHNRLFQKEKTINYLFVQSAYTPVIIDAENEIIKKQKKDNRRLKTDNRKK